MEPAWPSVHWAAAKLPSEADGLQPSDLVRGEALPFKLELDFALPLTESVPLRGNVKSWTVGFPVLPFVSNCLLEAPLE